MPKEIQVEVTPEGIVTISVNGVKGKSCLDLTKKLQDALGTTSSSVPTKEMNEKPQKTTLRISN